MCMLNMLQSAHHTLGDRSDRDGRCILLSSQFAECLRILHWLSRSPHFSTGIFILLKSMNNNETRRLCFRLRDSYKTNQWVFARFVSVLPAMAVLSPRSERAWWDGDTGRVRRIVNATRYPPRPTSGWRRRGFRTAPGKRSNSTGKALEQHWESFRTAPGNLQSSTGEALEQHRCA